MKPLLMSYEQNQLPDELAYNSLTKYSVKVIPLYAPHTSTPTLWYAETVCLIIEVCTGRAAQRLTGLGWTASEIIPAICIYKTSHYEKVT